MKIISYILNGAIMKYQIEYKVREYERLKGIEEKNAVPISYRWRNKMP